MNCDEAREILLTTDLFTEEQVLAASEHLRGCAGCREAIRDFTEIAAILATTKMGRIDRSQNKSPGYN